MSFLPEKFIKLTQILQPDLLSILNENADYYSRFFSKKMSIDNVTIVLHFVQFLHSEGLTYDDMKERAQQHGSIWEQLVKSKNFKLADKENEKKCRSFHNAIRSFFGENGFFYPPPIEKLLLEVRIREKRLVMALINCAEAFKKKGEHRRAVELCQRAQSICPSEIATTLMNELLAHASREKQVFGDVAVFGMGDCGQLGCGSGVDEARMPMLVPDLRGKNIQAVACGGLHTLVLTAKGEVFSFGCNDEGALGAEPLDEGFQSCKVAGFVPSFFGPNKIGPSPKMTAFGERIQILGEANIIKVVGGESTSFALSDVGDVYTWGTFRDCKGSGFFRPLPPPDDDRLPLGGKKYHKCLQDRPMHLLLDKKAKDLSAGVVSALALLEDGSVVTWGIAQHGDMGRKVPKLSKETKDEVVIEEFLKPKPVIWATAGLQERKVTAVSCGGYHLLAVVEEIEMNVYSCGLNQHGQLGLGFHKPDSVSELTKIPFFYGRNILKVQGGQHFSCFVNKTNKELYACGCNDCGQLGISIDQPAPGSFKSTPVRVPIVYSVDEGEISNTEGTCIIEDKIVEADQPEIEQISCGSFHTLVLTKDGDLYSWGSDMMGACGHGETEDILRPKKIDIKNLKNAQEGKYEVKFISGGGHHSAIVVMTALI